jgi:hypothetical protein
VIRLIAYLVGVASMGTIAQGTVGSGLHDVLWSTRDRTLAGETRIVTETTTVPGETTTHTRAPGETAPAPTTTVFVTVPGRTATTTVAGPAVTAVSAATETVSAPSSAITTTVPGPTTTTTVPGPTTTTTVPGPLRTTTVSGPAVTTTVSGPTETVTETVTVTEACDPPPKRPSDPPCPPHKK